MRGETLRPSGGASAAGTADLGEKAVLKDQQLTLTPYLWVGSSATEISWVYKRLDTPKLKP